MNPLEHEINALRWAQKCRKLTAKEKRRLARLLRERELLKGGTK